MYCWSLAWRIYSITSVWDECNYAVVWTFFSIAFLCDWNENWPFPVFLPLLSFPYFLAYWVQHFHRVIFQDFEIAPVELYGIPSCPLVLFVVMLPKALLTSHSRMTGSRGVITPSWLSGLWRSFLYSSSVCSCHLFLISSASVRSLPCVFVCVCTCVCICIGHYQVFKTAPWK